MEKLIMLVGVVLDLVEDKKLAGDELTTTRVLLEKVQAELAFEQEMDRRVDVEILELLDKVGKKSKLISDLQQLVSQKNAKLHQQDLELDSLRTILVQNKDKAEEIDRLYKTQKFLVNALPAEGEDQMKAVRWAISEALHEGTSKLQIIKDTRLALGSSLREAKDLVEKVMDVSGWMSL